MSERTIGVFLLDDHEIVRLGVRDLLEADPSITVVGEASTAAEAIARIPATRPDVALIDVGLPDGTGIEVCREVRNHHPEVACLILTSYSDEQALIDAILAGAAGYLLKQIRANELVEAVHRVAEGQSLIDPSMTAAVLDRIRHPEKYHDPLEDLSELERRILDLVAAGLTNKEIGAELYLAEKTVKNYISGLLAKLGVERRTEAAVLATRHQRRGYHLD